MGKNNAGYVGHKALAGLRVPLLNGMQAVVEFEGIVLTQHLTVA
jgi:hypothetical protein